MITLRSGAVAAVVAAALLAGGAWPARAAGESGAVFVQTNDPSANAIVVYDRQPNGRLALAATYPTGGRGGREPGSASDPLASQGSLVMDAAAGLLFAVNAGSDSVSVFSVAGDRLHLDQVTASGGPFPVSIAVSGGLAYVLNAGNDGSVSGFRIGSGSLIPINGSTRSLGLANGNPPFFLSAPAQIGFTPSGGQLAVTTKKNGVVDVFSVNPTGRLSETPTATSVGGAPFAFDLSQGRLALVNAGDSSLGTYAIARGGSLTLVGGPVSDGQVAACWITVTDGFDYVANTGSGTISQYRVSSGGEVSLIDAAAAAVPGAIDMAAARQFLYAQSGTTGSVEVFRVNGDGSLSPIQSVSVPGGSSQEGIVAT